jgi:hypothetical protein
MTPLPHDQDITSWLRLLSAIEDAEAGRETARLTEICLSVYGALAAAQFQITQLRARVHALTAAGPCPHGSPVTAATPRLPRARWDQRASSGDNTVGLPADEQQVLDTIENHLRVTDQQLTGAFAAFTRFASGTHMPRSERLTARNRLVTRLRGWRTGWLGRTAGGHGTSTG